MRPIGGFFELELPRCGRPLHHDALALTSGRACLALLLRQSRPRRALLPFYTCDAVIDAFAAAAVPVTFYGLTDLFAPDLADIPAADECLLYINYFALQEPTVAQLMRDFGSRLVVDDAQAFFTARAPLSWSFNSARKFFGVPDGAYLRGPITASETFAPNDAVRVDHLLHRMRGDLARGFAEHQDHERSFTLDVFGMSRVAGALLQNVDYGAVADRRRRNFAALDGRLRRHNRLPVEPGAQSIVPFCYPLLPAGDVSHEDLWQHHIFAPRLWPEVVSRRAPGFARERELASLLLPLPIDHRYGEDDMMRVADVIEELIA